MKQGLASTARCAVGGGAVVLLGLAAIAPVAALPPPDEIPEEVLRNQPIVIGRSPLDNTELSPSDYARLEAELIEAQSVDPRVPPKLQQLIMLLKIRKVMKSVIPFF